MFLEIHFLGKSQHFACFGPRYDDDTVAVSGDNITRSHLHAVTRNWNIGPGKAVVADRGRGNNAGGIDRETNLAQLSNVARAPIDDRTGEATGIRRVSRFL